MNLNHGKSVILIIIHNLKSPLTMKIFKNLTFYAIVILVMATCTSSTKSSNEESEASCTYQLDNQSLNFIWTAYKFTEKKGVPGTFDDITLDVKTAAQSLDELITSINFTINTSSINSKDPARDVKVSHFFFGTMANTDEITGSIKSVSGADAVIALTLNDLTLDIPGNLSFSGDTIKLSATVDFKAYGAEAALAKLNEVCNVEHTGEDGKSVFWDVVDINVLAVFSKKCD